MSEFDGYFEGAEDFEIYDAPRRHDHSNVGLSTVDVLGWGSFAELEFARSVAKYLAHGVTLSKGVNVRAFFGNHHYWQYRPDIVLSRPGKRIGLEVDGIPFHERVADGMRDSILVAGNIVSAIYRFGAGQTLYSAENCVYLLSRYERDFFDRRAVDDLLPRLASPRVRNETLYAPDGAVAAASAEPDADFDGNREPVDEPYTVTLTRVARELPIVAFTTAYLTEQMDHEPTTNKEMMLSRYRLALEVEGYSWHRWRRAV